MKLLQEKNKQLGPKNNDELHAWILENLGYNIPRTAVCDDHQTPFDFVADIYFERVDSAIAIASRDGGKTMCSALIHLLNSLFKPGCESITVGAIWAQSYRAYENLRKLLKAHGKVKDVEKHPEVIKMTQERTQFENSSTVEILPGCLPEHAMIVTAEGNKRIQEIVKNKLVGPVKTYNFKDNKFEWAEITDWHNNGQTDEWLQIKLKDSTLQGPSDIYCTPGHQLLTPNGEKKSAIEFSIDDELAIESRILSYEQKQIAIGMLLGDAYVHTNKRYRVCHTARQLNYLEWFMNAFSEFNPYMGRRIAQNTFDVDLQCSRVFSDLRREWYPDGIKRIPDYVWETLDTLGLACWLMDDGGWVRGGSEKQSLGGTWIINAMNFNSHEREKTQEYFDNMGIYGRWVCIVKEKDQWIWKTLEGNGINLQAIVSEYIDVSEHQEKGYKKWIAPLTTTHSDIGMVSAKIKSIKENKTRHGRFDITVPLNANYQISSGLIISNTISAVNGPHGQKVHRDEVELMDAETFKEANNISSSKIIIDYDVNGKEIKKEIKAQDWITSTRKYAHGQMQGLIDGIDEAERNGFKPTYKKYAWCVFECGQKVLNCRVAYPNLPDAEKCDCHTVVKGEWDDESPRRFSDVCRGRLARADGYTSLSDIQKKFLENDRDTWEAQKECSKPEVGGLIFPMFTKQRYGIKFYEPDPMYGDIYLAWDPGGSNPHSVHWYQVLDHALDVYGHDQDGKEEPIKRLKAGTVVCFDEIYKAEIGNTEIAEMVVLKEDGWRKEYPRFKVKRRFADVAAKAARLDWARHTPKLPTSYYVTREVKEHIKTCTSYLQDDMFVVDTKRCPMFINEAESWAWKKARPGVMDAPEEPVKDFDHAMSEFRYAMENIKYIARRTPTNSKPKYGQKKHIIRNVAKSSAPRYLPRDGR